MGVGRGGDGIEGREGWVEGRVRVWVERGKEGVGTEENAATNESMCPHVEPMLQNK